MAEYIDREETIKELQKRLIEEHNCGFAFIDSDFIDFLNDLPTEDVVKVVRCKDCVYNKGQLPVPEDNLIRCHREMPKLRKPHDYCSYGERKEQ